MRVHPIYALFPAPLATEHELQQVRAGELPRQGAGVYAELRGRWSRMWRGG